jgi:hypothetical protein
MKHRIGAQAVGAYGEKIVEAELLRRGWIPSNVNVSVKNAADYDVIAQHERRVALLRVKTCGPGQRAFQFSIKPGRKFTSDGLPANDFTVLVSMGETRTGDEIWVVPTIILRQRLRSHQDDFLSQPRRDGGDRKDTGQWTLWLDPLKRGAGHERPARGVATAWESYRDGWDHLLEAIR